MASKRVSKILAHTKTTHSSNIQASQQQKPTQLKIFFENHHFPKWKSELMLKNFIHIFKNIHFI